MIIKILSLFACLVANEYFYKFFLKVDYQAFLGVYLTDNQSNFDFVVMFINFIINIITGVNIYDLESCLRIFGVI